MKVSKLILSAIIVGITVQGISCTKINVKPKTEDSEKKADPCPACGMG